MPFFIARGLMEDFTHINSQGRARMVDVSEKQATSRLAKASCVVNMQPSTLELIKTGGIKKGDVLSVAQVAGIQAAKNTFQQIPMAHQIALKSVDINFTLAASSIKIESIVKCTDSTGVEMEALCAVSTAALTIYDMCKAVDRAMEITDIHLDEKRGGKSGVFIRK